jgi:hypothetical protein
MKMQPVLCGVVLLALCGAVPAQSARTGASQNTPQAASARCDRLSGAERKRCLKESRKSARKPQPADEHSGAGSSAPGGRADGEPGSYGPKAPPKATD